MPGEPSRQVTAAVGCRWGSSGFSSLARCTLGGGAWALSPHSDRLLPRLWHGLAVDDRSNLCRLAELGDR